MKLRAKLILSGLVLGLAFVLSGVIIGILKYDLSFAFYSFIELHKISPIQYLIDTSPVVLPLLAWYIAVLLDKEQLENKTLIERDLEKSRQVVEFVTQLNRGNYDIHFNLADEGEVVGKVLENLKDTLNRTDKENKQRMWFNEGMAMFTNLWTEAHDVKELTLKMNTMLVNYLNVNQGGLYILKKDDETGKLVMELKACLAFNRQKMINNTFIKGEGLVGRCWAEGKYIHLTEIPENYIRITSGLGDAPPGNLLLMPMMQRDKVLGVVELASFQPFTQQEIEFVQQVGESMASIINSITTNEQTSKLLKDAERNAEMLQSQEEVLRRNAVELFTAQDEMRKRLEQLTKAQQAEEKMNAELKSAEFKLRREMAKMKSVLDSSPECILIVDRFGEITDFNPAAKSKLELTHEDSEAVNIKDIFQLSCDATEFLLENNKSSVDLQFEQSNGNKFDLYLYINEVEGQDRFSIFINDQTKMKNTVRSMEETLTEFQDFMSEQVDIQSKLEAQLEEARMEVKRLEGKKIEIKN